jgi:hypothetical protein
MDVCNLLSPCNRDDGTKRASGAEAETDSYGEPVPLGCAQRSSPADFVFPLWAKKKKTRHAKPAKRKRFGATGRRHARTVSNISSIVFSCNRDSGEGLEEGTEEIDVHLSRLLMRSQGQVHRRY